MSRSYTFGWDRLDDGTFDVLSVEDQSGRERCLAHCDKPLDAMFIVTALNQVYGVPDPPRT